MIGFATDQTVDLLSFDYDRKILKVWSKSVPAFSKNCCQWLREIWMKTKISKIMKIHEKMEKKMKKSLFQKLFMVDLWVLGSRFQPFRNVSDHFWSTSGRFRLSRINYKQIFKKWKFWFFSSNFFQDELGASWSVDFGFRSPEADLRVSKLFIG